ncbi:MAG TPA: helix-turn-helix domain-containing protein [Candidatus Woesebacteria bacterium]|nr:helix-turn-helix domain-containing protein [Candidatus Woesebacteria bacterium]
MSDQTDRLTNLVMPYGLSDEEVKVYLYLLTHGYVTALELSRQLHLGRTKVYRLLDLLKNKELVEIKLDERGMKFGATHPRKLEQLVGQKQAQVTALSQALPSLVSELTALLPHKDQSSKVLYYEGLSGLEQVSFNTTRAEKLLRVFEMSHMSEFLSNQFAEDIRHRFVANQILTRDITNQKEFGEYTQVYEMVEKYSEYRHLDPKKLKIGFEVLIYNDVYATYTYDSEEIFCVEIYNSQLAEMQKQLFDYVWEQSQVMKYTSRGGAAKID